MRGADSAFAAHARAGRTLRSSRACILAGGGASLEPNTTPGQSRGGPDSRRGAATLQVRHRPHLAARLSPRVSPVLEHASNRRSRPRLRLKACGRSPRGFRRAFPPKGGSAGPVAAPQEARATRRAPRGRRLCERGALSDPPSRAPRPSPDCNRRRAASSRRSRRLNRLVARRGGRQHPCRATPRGCVNRHRCGWSNGSRGLSGSSNRMPAREPFRQTTTPLSWRSPPISMIAVVCGTKPEAKRMPTPPVEMS